MSAENIHNQVQKTIFFTCPEGHNLNRLITVEKGAGENGTDKIIGAFSDQTTCFEDGKIATLSTPMKHIIGPNLNQSTEDF